MKKTLGFIAVAIATLFGTTSLTSCGGKNEKNVQTADTTTAKIEPPKPKRHDSTYMITPNRIALTDIVLDHGTVGESDVKNPSLVVLSYKIYVKVDSMDQPADNITASISEEDEMIRTADDKKDSTIKHFDQNKFRAFHDRIYLLTKVKDTFLVKIHETGEVGKKYSRTIKTIYIKGRDQIFILNTSSFWIPRFINQKLMETP